MSRKVLASEPLTKNTYLTQGLVLVTVGLSQNTSTRRARSRSFSRGDVILFILGTLRKNIFLQPALPTAAMAVVWGIDGLARNDTRGLWLGTTIGALMALNAFWSHWRMAWS